MANITLAFKQAYLDMQRKGWTPRLYVFVDIHSTVSKPTYEPNCTKILFYPFAKEALQMLSEREDIVLIYYSCTPIEQCKKQVELYKAHGIIFDYINENPEITNSDTTYGCYLYKPYFNILLDDKAGFDPTEDWEIIINYYKVFYEDKKK